MPVPRAAHLVLPRVFGEGWSGPLFQTNWRAAFFYTGVVSIVLAFVYYALGEAAKSEEKRQATADSATLKQWVHTATRYGTVVLALAYVMTFGLELSMNGWLATYYRGGFNTSNLVLASTFAATFSVAAGLLRPSAATSATSSPATSATSSRGSRAATANSGRSSRCVSSSSRWSA